MRASRGPTRFSLPRVMLTATFHLGALSLLSAQTWIDVGPRPDLYSIGARITYDEGRDRLVLFGGIGATTPASKETWEWDGSRWIRRVPPVSPPARTGHALTYDAARGRVVLFGGRGDQGLTLSDHWEWDGATWERMQPMFGPPPFHDPVMTYDSVRRRVILVPGGHTPKLDVWEWDGTSWHVQPTTVQPELRANFSLVFDPVRGLTYLFGGVANGVVHSDLWAWDGTSWRLLTTGHPSPRHGHGAAWDASRGLMVLFGGRRPDGTYLDQTVTFDGSSWVHLPAAHPPAPAAERHLAYSPSLRRVLMFGGFSGTNLSLERRALWDFDGTRWNLRHVPQTPVGFGTTSEDPARGGILYFGGMHPDSNETWSFDGNDWRRLRPNTVPPRRVGALMASDPMRGRVVLIGGGDPVTSSRLRDGWEWDGSDWTAMTNVPPLLLGASIAPYPPGGHLVLCGSPDLVSPMETWTWDGTIWTRLQPATTPPLRSAAALAYDATRGRLLLFGGNDANGARNDTWTWDGSNWRAVATTTQPEPRLAAGMVHDPATGGILLHGGGDQNGTWFVDTWTFDGANWTRLATTGDPRGGSGVTLARHGTRDQIVRFAGGSYEHEGTWILTRNRATTLIHGTGCPGSSGIPWLASKGVPRLGEPAFALEVGSARANAPVVFLLGDVGIQVPVGSGCSLYTNAQAIFTLPANTSGFASLPLPLPVDLSLRGGSVFAQAIIADPRGAFEGMLSSTAGLELTLGE